jgi:hypothetical protein
MPGKQAIKELQKTAILGTAYKTSDSTDVKVQNIQKEKKYYIFHKL